MVGKTRRGSSKELNAGEQEEQRSVQLQRVGKASAGSRPPWRYKGTLQLDENIAIARYNEACLLKNSGWLKEVLICYDKVLKISPQIARARYEKGNF